jgi:hypothetical protein
LQKISFLLYHYFSYRKPFNINTMHNHGILFCLHIPVVSIFSPDISKHCHSLPGSRKSASDHS